MAELEEQRTDEREALLSIYEGDTNFNQIDANTFQYKVIFDVKLNNVIFVISISVWRNRPL